MPKSPSLKSLLLAATLVIVTYSAVAAVWDQNRKTTAAGSDFTYETASASRGPVRRTVQSSGTVRPLVTVLVGSQLSGQIKTIRVDFNSEVSQGEVLAQLDDKSFVARVEQAAADLEMAKADVTNHQAALEKANANLLQAERSAARARELKVRGVTAQAQLDTAERDVAVGRAEIAVVRAQMESARANVAQRQALLAQASIDLDRTQIRAPIAGVVVSRTVEIGQTVAASLQAPELFRIAQDLRRIRIEAQVNEADIGDVAKGNPVAFRVDAYPGRTFAGRVQQIRLSATEEQGVVTYTVVIEAPNDDAKLFPGMTANVEIESDKRDNVLRVPVDALRYRPRGAVPAEAGTAKRDRPKRDDASGTQSAGGKDTARSEQVYSLGLDGQPQRKRVRVGLTDGRMAEILDGEITEGDVLIVRSRGSKTKK